MEKRERENNNNVILLIVIAIATMVIVVIGATFAYLASSAAENDTANINAGFQGGGSDLLLIDAGKDLSVNATFDNFGKGVGDQTDYGLAKVVLQAADAGSTSYKYDIYLDTEENNMIYTAGTCYAKTEVTGSYADQTDCLTDAAGARVWARTTDSEGSCRIAPGTGAIPGQLYESEQGCLTNADNMWVVQDGVAELAFDLYQEITVDSENACVGQAEDGSNKTLGTCVDKTRNIFGGTNTTSDDCIAAGYTWVPNYFDSDEKVCYKLTQSRDITIAKPGEEGKVPVLQNVEINAINGEATTQRYRVAVSLINLPHNQIANGGHTYTGRLNIVVQSKTTPTPGPGDDNTTTGLEKPVITLTGDAATTVEQGTAYTDPGVTITDNKDDGLTPTVTYTFKAEGSDTATDVSSIDTSQLGVYTIKYNVTDSDSNAAAEVTRTVTVVAPAGS